MLLRLSLRNKNPGKSYQGLSGHSDAWMLTGKRTDLEWVGGKMSEPAKIFQQIAAVMRDIEAVGKDQKNTVQNFKFRGIDQIYNELHPIMAKHKIFTVPTILSRDYKELTTAKGTVMHSRVLTIQYRFYAEDGSYVDAVADGEAMDSGDKSTSKCMAIAHKYALLQTFCIPTEDNKEEGSKDPDAHTPEPTLPKPKVIVDTALAPPLDPEMGLQLNKLLESLKLDKTFAVKRYAELFPKKHIKDMTTEECKQVIDSIYTESQMK
jgi:hypothetical protein